MKRSLTSLLLAAAMLLCMMQTLAGCAAPDQTDEGSETQEDVVFEAGTDAYDRLHTPDNLPELDFQKKVIRILTRTGDEDTRIEFIAEKGSTDVVESAVYERNKLVEDRLNIEFEYIETSDTRHAGSAINELLARTVTSGTDEYDIIANHMSQTTTSVLAGNLLNLNTLEYLDWNQPWWNRSYRDEVSVAGKQYLAVGELTLSYISGTYAMYFNKFMWDNYYNGDDLYQVVKAGEWTLDKLTSYTTDMWQDSDGKNGLTENDVVGLFHCTSALCDGFAGAAGVRFTEYDEENDAYAFVLNEPRTFEFIDRMKLLLFESNSTFIGPDDFKIGLEKLSQNTALFTPNILGGSIYLRSMEKDYGIIPMPKLDTVQEDYTTFVHNGFSVVGIPTTVKDPDMMAAVTEALCAESYRRVTYAYYDTALKYKYNRDPQAVEMLDIITGNIRFDFAYCYNQSLDTVAAIFRTVLATTSDISRAASTIKNKQRSAEKNIERLVQKIEKLKV